MTRFNVRAGFGPPEGVSSAWMDARLELFRRFCVPSVARQWFQDFRWLIFLDRETPRHYVRELEGILRGVPQAMLTYLDRWYDDWAVAAVYLLAKSDVVVTTRLDNDDALHEDFMHLVAQRAAVEPPGTFIEFLSGYTYDLASGRLKRFQFPGNSFPSFVERRRTEMLTVHQGNHLMLREKGRMVTLDEPSAWLQVIHGSNVSNKEQGIPVDDVDSVLAKFGFSAGCR